MGNVSMKMVLVYADDTSARLCARVSSSLRMRLGEEFQVAQSVWNMELLHDAELRRSAAAEAMRSDIIMIALGESAEVPNHLAGWFSLWRHRRRPTPGAFVALFNGGSHAPCRRRAAARLRQAARRAGMEFFCHGAGLGETDEHASRETALPVAAS